MPDNRDAPWKGSIAHVNLLRGFGFVAALGGPDVWFHRSDLRGAEFDEQLNGRRVLFELAPNDRGGLVAVNVRPAD